MSKSLKLSKKSSSRYMDTGELLREARAAQGMTLAELGKKIGVSVSYLSDIERGHRGLSFPRAILAARVLTESADFMFHLVVYELDKKFELGDAGVPIAKLIVAAVELEGETVQIPEELPQELPRKLEEQKTIPGSGLRKASSKRA